MGALSASVVTYLWNRRNPNEKLSILLMTVLGAIVARIPDWDINLVAEFGLTGSNWAHRSVYTHSILGIILFGTILAMAIIATNHLGKRLEWASSIPVELVTFILTISFVTHLVFDALEAYPTRTLYPITDNEFSGWIPSSVYYSNFFLFSSWIVGFGGSIALILADKEYNSIQEDTTSGIGNTSPEVESEDE